MAIIRSLAVGKARKSAGNLTFRTVRGRTIASEKVAPGAKTRGLSESQSERTRVFGLITRFGKMHADSIKASFTRTKYGSERNAFVKINYAALYAALLPLASRDVVTDQEIDDAVTNYSIANPNAIVRVHLQGLPTMYLSGEWGEDVLPGGVITGVSIDGSLYALNADRWITKDLKNTFVLSFQGSGLENVTISGVYFINKATDEIVRDSDQNNQVSVSDTEILLTHSVTLGAAFVLSRVEFVGAKTVYFGADGEEEGGIIDPDA